MHKNESKENATNCVKVAGVASVINWFVDNWFIDGRIISSSHATGIFRIEIFHWNPF